METDDTNRNSSPGQRIRQARLKNGLTQLALGESVGVSRNAVSLWESDKSRPSTSNISRIARILDVSADWLLSGDKDRDGQSGTGLTVNLGLRSVPIVS